MELEADDFGNQHGEGLAEHGGFGLDPADAPAEDAEAIDHGGVRVGADERIGVGLHPAAGGHAANHASEIFEIDLMADAGVRRNNFEILKSLLAPAEERVTLDVALEFELGVEAEGIDAAEAVHLDGVVDDQLGGEERIDALGVAAHLDDGFAHGGEVHDGGHAGEILQEDAGGHEGNLFLRCAGFPGGEGADVVGADEVIVFVAKEIFEQDAEREGKTI